MISKKTVDVQQEPRPPPLFRPLLGGTDSLQKLLSFHSQASNDTVATAGINTKGSHENTELSPHLE